MKLSKNKIVIVTSEFGQDGGGLSYSCYKFAKMLLDFGAEIKIVISNPKEKILNSDFIFFKSSHLVVNGGYRSDLDKHLWFRSFISEARCFLKEFNPDYVIAFGAGYNSLIASELLNEFSQFIVLLRGSEINLSISDNDLLHANKLSLKKANYIIGVSNELIERSKQIIYNSRSHYKVIPNSLNSIVQIVELGFKNHLLFGTYAKYLNEKKGIANLLISLHFLNVISNNLFKLELIGDIDDSLMIQYKKIISDYQLQDKVNFIGYLPRKELLSVVRKWDFIIQSSFCEGSSNLIAEAINNGIPFMLTNTGYFAEEIITVEPSLVFKSFAPDKIAAQINENVLNHYFTDKCNKVSQILYEKICDEKIRQYWFDIFDNSRVITAKTINFNQILSIILHDISADFYDSVTIPFSIFENVCNNIYKKGFRFCSAKEYFNNNVRDNLIICSFDDGYKSIYEYVFPLFEKLGFTATVFICPEHIGTFNNWNCKDKRIRKHLELEELIKLFQNNWEIGSHGLNHNSFLKLSEIEIKESIENSKIRLSEHFGNIVSFAYPYGDYNDFSQLIVKDYFKFIFAVDKGGTHFEIDRQQIRRYTIDQLQKILEL